MVEQLLKMSTDDIRKENNQLIEELKNKGNESLIKK
ncbi:hypothetical protein IGK99_000833 [Enterococcus sp. DIV1059_1]